MSSALLMSGGMDSISLCYWRRPDIAITIDYGQRPAGGEIRASKAVCNSLNVEHVLLKYDLANLGFGDLSDRPASPLGRTSDWWPYRNQMLVTLAAMWLARQPVEELLIGIVSTDHLHGDGTSGFIRAMSALLEIQEGAVRLEAPGLVYTTAELVQVSNVPISLLAYSHSCHVSDVACGACHGCEKHYAAMEDLGIGPY